MRASLLASIVLSLGLSACGDADPETPPGEAPVAEAGGTETPSAPEPPVVKKESLAHWTVANIDQLQPVVPSRTATTPVPLPEDPAIDQTLAILGKAVDKHGTDPTNPWAIGHAMLARGPELQLGNGQPAIPYLFETYGETFQAGEHTLIRFPKSQGSVRVEPHTELMLKVLTETGVDPSTPVKVQGQDFTVADLWRGAVIKTGLDPQQNRSNYAGTNDMPWSLQAMAAWAPKRLEWTSVDSIRMNLDDLATFNMTVLVSESKPLFDAMQAEAGFEKKGQGIFAYTCGGAHLLQGVAYANQRGFGPELGPRFLQEQVDLLYYRLPRELQLYDDLMRKAPQHTVLLLVQRLKFTGHFLESAHKLAAMGVYTPDDEQKKLLEGAAQQVILTTRALEEQAAFDAMDAIRVDNEQLYLDLIGDSSHAINGLLLAQGKREVRY